MSSAMKPTIYILLSLVFVLWSCGHLGLDREVDNRLDVAEQLMTERPDSALVVLKAIDYDDIATRNSKARYALLYSQAQDKTHLLQTDISLISKAKEYYEESDDVRYKFLSYYYYGRVLYNRGEYTRAVVVFTQAEDMLKQLNDNYLAGLLYTQLGNIYSKHYDYSKSLTAFQASYNHYLLAGLEYHQAHALHDIAAAYCNLGELDEAVAYFTKALDRALELADEELEIACYQNLIIQYDIMYEYEKCGEIVDLLTSKFDESLYQPKCLGSLASYCAEANQYARAEGYLNSAWAKASDAVDSVDMYFKSANTMKQMGRTDEALRYFEEGITLQNKHLRSAMQQPIITAQKDYFQNQAEFNAYRLKTNRQIYIIVSIVVVLIMMAVAVYIRHKIVAKNNAINRYMEAMQDLEKSLLTSDMAVDSMAKQVNNLFVKQFAFIDKLSNTYYETHGTKRDKEAIYTQVRNEIERLQTDKRHIQQLEDIVNKNKGNVMKSLRESMPEFSEMDYRLLCFLYAGFSAKAISVFTGDSIGNIYMRKSRLKSKIAQSNAENKEQILYHLQ